ncbi:unnamed protein product (macronuclear) [Paramecium tetraurelia]|uniref:Protein kinase domain-containing protein n=1 Tax=Paramecium tetraurelia TaxID=5888 RepID=A0BJS4_PARTE|nr:uncharacterized protein GSPATT00029420001 [Paramecium tetraurelia]CAK58791.1 unnamed protein product [Paramecium tetraurelia]|eukprot:XP_001426189.1 hypothetical protein (macronuclear) [Paramecium tetraurelia strain d4-2]
MICIKKNLLFHDSFSVEFLSDSIRLSNSKKMVQHKIKLLEDTTIEWKLSKCQQKLTGFGILVNGLWEYFDMERSHLELFKQFLDAKISYRNIHKIYQMVSFCGRGTYGHVFKYQNRLTEEYVACKSLKMGSAYKYEDFMREVKALQRLKHPKIVKMKEYYVESKHFYIVMEYLEGRSLKELLKSRNLKEQEIFIIFKQVLVCINHIHKEGYVYRDIKQENVLFGETDNLQTVKLIDFGLTEKKSDLGVWQNRVCGTPGYLAPEMLKPQNTCNDKIDMFGLGILLWEMIHNCRFFQGGNLDEVLRLNEKYTFCQEYTQNIENPTLKYLVERMLQQNPEDRISSADALSYLSSAERNSCECRKNYDNDSTD